MKYVFLLSLAGSIGYAAYTYTEAPSVKRTGRAPRATHYPTPTTHNGATSEVRGTTSEVRKEGKASSATLYPPLPTSLADRSKRASELKISVQPATLPTEHVSARTTYTPTPKYTTTPVQGNGQRIDQGSVTRARRVGTYSVRKVGTRRVGHNSSEGKVK